MKDFEYIEEDNAIRFIDELDKEIVVDRTMVLMIRHVYTPDNDGLCKEYSFVGRIHSYGTGGIFKFVVLAAESSDDRYKYYNTVGVWLNELILCREFKMRDVPLLVNWSWIGLDIRHKYFRV